MGGAGCDAAGAGMKYRKKPVVIEAVQLPFKIGEIPDWIFGHNITLSQSLEYARIATLEGVMDAGPGDWIIRGIKGEIYPCKPDIFAATYEPVE
jgi:hypothetical protein